jgi:hypothetical protein
MNDPKFNELPVEKTGDFEKKSEVDSEEQQDARAKKNRAGLSINETVAANANLSVGSRGVDTSGVRAGAGAGAGMTATAPSSPGSTPAATIVPGARGSGTTATGSGGTDQNPSLRLDTDSGVSSEDAEIQALAHELWVERGCPLGSPEVDWNRATEEVRRRREYTRTAAATA